MSTVYTNINDNTAKQSKQRNMFTHRARAILKHPLKHKHTHVRGLKVQVSNPWAIFALNQSKAVLKGVGIFYAGALVMGTGAYFGAQWYVDQWQPMHGKWSLYTKCLGRLGVYLQESGDETNAEMSLIYCLKSIAQAEGMSLDNTEDSPRKFQLLNLEQLQNKSTDFKSKYLDMVMRLALVKAELGDVENGWKLSQYALNVPMDQGSHVLRSQTMRLAAKLESIKGNYANAEAYLLDTVRFNEYNEDNVHFVQHGSLTLSKDSTITTELFSSLLDLGVIYTKMSQQTKSLEIFLNLLQLTQDKQPYKEFPQANRALLKNYIGEVLYSQGLTDKSIEWCCDAFREARIDSKFDPLSASVTKQSLQNLVKLYEKTNEKDLAQQAREQLGKCEIPVKVNRQWALLEKMLS